MIDTTKNKIISTEVRVVVTKKGESGLKGDNTQYYICNRGF